ncbi:hypothetical protein AVEN_255963-1 [Araneus ventricosus]|uniref:Uncharacterized protein n=1 Tax=Araneus ventricosus TaxID=182803 RepID=A0A4Y2UWJ8_ARAVE|nr:hypothetical protein AVEN_255963-1 [Araneus ventricosus]
MHFCHLSYKDVNANYKPPFAISSSIIFSELENLYDLNKFLIRGQEKNYLERDQENKLILEVPDCDVLTDKLTTGGTWDPAPYPPPMPWLFTRWEILNACNHEL